jgi:hypothetical protein
VILTIQSIDILLNFFLFYFIYLLFETVDSVSKLIFDNNLPQMLKIKMTITYFFKEFKK